MKFSPISSKLPTLIQKQNKNEVELANKIEQSIKLRPTDTNIAPYKILYDSGWSDITPEDIPGATSQVENLELPQRVPFEFTTSLEIPEVYLPFIDIAVLTNPIETQKVIGVGAFVFSGLQEVLLKLYNWLGLTAIESYFGNVVETSVSIPALPESNIPYPYPQNCYTRETYFTSVSVVAQRATMNLQVTPDGEHVIDTPIQVPSRVTLDVIAGFLAEYSDIPGPGFGLGTMTWQLGQHLNFKYNPADFPVPMDDKSKVPCGADIYRDPELINGMYFSQYWSLLGFFTLEEYMGRFPGHTYAQTKALFTQFYPDIFITPEVDGPPYKSYQRINSNVVESGDLKIKIVKSDNNSFQFSVYGNILLLSPANTETDYSDPIFPTYQPNANPLSVRLLVTFKDHPVNFIQSRMFRNDT